MPRARSGLAVQVLPSPKRKLPPRPVGLHRLADVTAVLGDALPLKEPDLGLVLMGLGLATGPTTFAQLARLYRTRREKIPFGIVRWGGVPIGVGIISYGAAAQVAAASSHMTQHWGLASVEGVAARAASLAGRAVTEALARRVLSALPGIHWLDGEARGWFSFTGNTGGLLDAVLKIFAVATRVELAHLHAALAKGLPGVDEAPAPVLARYLADLAGCTVDGSTITRPGGGGGGGDLTHGERTLVELLRAAGGAGDLDALRRDARAAAVPRTTVNRLIDLSPLFLPAAPGRVRLVGV